jgi:acylphosphatase
MTYEVVLVMMIICARVIFYGKVQGVFFRSNSQFKAHEMGIVGTVRNLSDGRVEAFVQGERKKVDEFIRWCSEDMPRAHVTRKDVEYLDCTEEFPDFIIIR